MDLFNSGRKVKMEKYLVSEQEAFKQGKFKVYAMKRTENGKTQQEFVIKASGGQLRFTMDEFQDLQKVLEKITQLDYRWRQSMGLDYK
jgi:hypothetical protein